MTKLGTLIIGLFQFPSPSKSRAGDSYRCAIRGFFAESQDASGTFVPLNVVLLGCGGVAADTVSGPHCWSVSAWGMTFQLWKGIPEREKKDRWV